MTHVWPKPGSVHTVPIMEKPEVADPDNPTDDEKCALKVWRPLKDVILHVRLLSANDRNRDRHAMSAAVARERARLHKLKQQGDHDMDYIAITAEGMDDIRGLNRALLCSCVIKTEGVTFADGSRTDDMSVEEMADALDSIDLLDTAANAARAAQSPKPHQLDS